MNTPLVKKIIFCLFTLAISAGIGALTGCAKAPPPSASAVSALPEDWYRLPEDGLTVKAGEPEFVEPPAVVGEQFAETINTQKEVLEDLSPVESPAPATGILAAAPGGFVPWRLAAFITDLSVSASGILGSLTVKGTPAFSLIWRKKEAKAPLALESMADISIASDTSSAQVDEQLDAAVRAAMATGHVKDEARLRRELGGALAEFRQLTGGLDRATMQEWWVSRFRMDLSVEASGKAAFFTSLGADMRLRFEWHRIKRNQPVHAGAPAIQASTPRIAEGQRSFNELVEALSSDLSVLSVPGSDVHHGYQPYTFRVGVGVTAGGTFGVIKGSATAMGQVQFSRDVPKPSVVPLTTSVGGIVAVREEPGEINMIETASSLDHVGFARTTGVQTMTDGALDQVIYRVNRAQMRKGLAKAQRMAGFFARRARHVSTGHWGLYELRASFDMSVSGKFGVATANGLATSEICLYNEEF